MLNSRRHWDRLTKEIETENRAVSTQSGNDQKLSLRGVKQQARLAYPTTDRVNIRLENRHILLVFNWFIEQDVVSIELELGRIGERGKTKLVHINYEQEGA